MAQARKLAVKRLLFAVGAEYSGGTAVAESYVIKRWTLVGQTCWTERCRRTVGCTQQDYSRVDVLTFFLVGLDSYRVP